MRANEFGARHRGAAGARKGLRIRSDDDPTPPVDAIGGGCDYAGAQPAILILERPANFKSISYASRISLIRLCAYSRKPSARVATRS